MLCGAAVILDEEPQEAGEGEAEGADEEDDGFVLRGGDDFAHLERGDELREDNGEVEYAHVKSHLALVHAFAHDGEGERDERGPAYADDGKGDEEGYDVRAEEVYGGIACGHEEYRPGVGRGHATAFGYLVEHKDGEQCAHEVADKECP